MSESGKIESYRDLMVWHAMDLAELCYLATKDFPREELYGLTSQMRRSATSIPANIAEGYGRESTGSCVQFLRNAQGSIKELETHVILSGRVGMLAADRQTALLDRTEEIGRMLRALIRSIQRSGE